MTVPSKLKCRISAYKVKFRFTVNPFEVAAETRAIVMPAPVFSGTHMISWSGSGFLPVWCSFKIMTK